MYFKDSSLIKKSKMSNAVAAEPLPSVTNGDGPNSKGEIDKENEPDSHVVELDCQTVDIDDKSAKVEKFSSKLKETSGLENGCHVTGKEYKETSTKSTREKLDNKETASSSAHKKSEKERVAKSASGGKKKSEYSSGTDEQLKTSMSSVERSGKAVTQSNRQSDSNYSKSCSKIEEELPGNHTLVRDAGGTVSQCTLGAGRRVAESARSDYSHSEHTASSTHGPQGSYKSEGKLVESTKCEASHTSETTPTGSTTVQISSKRESKKKESLIMESSSSSGLQDVGEAASASAADGGSSEHVEQPPQAQHVKPGEIKLTTKISSDDNGLLNGLSGKAITASAKLDSEINKDTGGASNGPLYTRQTAPMSSETTPSDAMSVSSMSELNDIKMSSASSSESASRVSVERKVERKSSADDLVSRILAGEDVKSVFSSTAASKRDKYKIDMRLSAEDEELGSQQFASSVANANDRSLLERRLANLDNKSADNRSMRSEESYELEETSYSRKRTGRQASDRARSLDRSSMESPGGYRYRTRQGFERAGRSQFDFDDNDDFRRPRDRNRFSRQQYVDDDDVFDQPPMVPLFHDSEFEPKRRDETDEIVKERTTNIRGMVEMQSQVLENLRKASESFDELTDEIKNIKQSFLENQARRAMILSNLERGERRSRRGQDDQDYGYDDPPPPPRNHRFGSGDSGYDDGLLPRGRQGQIGASDSESGYRSSYARNLQKDLDDYEESRALAITKTKKSLYANEELSLYGASGDDQNRRARSMGGRSKSLYDEASGLDNDDLEGGLSSRKKLLGRTKFDPFDDTASSGYGSNAYGSGTSGYQRLGTSASSYSSSTNNSYTSRYSSGSGAAASGTSAYNGNDASANRSRFSRSRTLSDVGFDRSSSPPTYGSGSTGQSGSGFNSRFLKKVRQKSLDDPGRVSLPRDKPFKSRFLRSTFDSDSGASSEKTKVVDAKD